MATQRKRNPRKGKTQSEITQTVEEDGTQADRPAAAKGKRKAATRRAKINVLNEASEKSLKEFVKAACELGVKGVLDEFLTIRTETQTVTKPKTGHEKNPDKNRYKDVFCIDETRVILKPTNESTTPPTEVNDYIHANWVKSNGINKFICTQGPTEKTIEDFWKMVWQEKAPCVVMLCNIMELGKKKCEQYWSDTVDKPLVLMNGQLTVKTMELPKEVESNILMMKLQLLDDKGATHNVEHWQWKAWPDRGVPENPMSTFRLLFRLKLLCPIVVHCSAGIGRTGTIVGLDIAYQKLIAGEKIALNQIVRDIRNQRHGSVQTDTQYLFMHRVLFALADNRKIVVPEMPAFVAEYDKTMAGKA